MKRLGAILILFAVIASISGQDVQFDRSIKVSGQVLTSDSLRPVPFANIKIRSSKLGAVSDFKGSFHFDANRTDTIIISSVGFKKTTIIIPDTVGSDFFLRHLVLYPDTTQLQEVTIRAWPTLESFRQDFINESIPDDYYIIAMNNLLSNEINKYAQELPMDATMNSRYFLQQIGDKYYYSGQIIPFTIFDVFRWKAFFDMLTDKP